MREQEDRQDNYPQNQVPPITRREINRAIISASIGLLPPGAIGSSLLPAGNAAKAEIKQPSPALIHQRHWSADSRDRSTHVLGNGYAMVHELGPNIAYFRAPWISSPNLLTMDLLLPASMHTISSRERGTAIWHHTLYAGSDQVGEIIDFLDASAPTLRRVIRCSLELTFAVASPRLVEYPERYRDYNALLGQWPYGSTIYGDFKSSDPFTLAILFSRRSHFQTIDSSTTPAQANVSRDPSLHHVRIVVPPGSSTTIIAAGARVQSCFETVDRSLVASNESALNDTRRSWKTRLTGLDSLAMNRDAIAPAAYVTDDVATLLLGHQSNAGSVAAGQVYPLFYVRDQYGVSRALIAMNMAPQAKAILAYYHQIWIQYGRIHNAQSDGPRHWFHHAENDDVEMTGYLILQAFDYLDATQDADFIAAILPMLEWALNAQEGQLSSDMLPFNGDETYVAGGVFPRTHLDDGSSEATLLYLASSDRLLSWIEKRGMWPADKIARRRETALRVKDSYARHFVTQSGIAVNRPREPISALLPRFRYGVCLGHYDANCLFLSDTEIAEDGRYFCYSCYPKRTRQIYDPRTYFIPSVGLTSFLTNYSAVPGEVMRRTTVDAVSVFTQSGAFAWPRTILPGYETAIVSLALSRQNDPRAAEFLQRMLTLRDTTGAWAEYYVDANPQGCRCRPWESALSLVALLDHLKAAPRRIDS